MYCLAAGCSQLSPKHIWGETRPRRPIERVRRTGINHHQLVCVAYNRRPPPPPAQAPKSTDSNPRRSPRGWDATIKCHSPFGHGAESSRWLARKAPADEDSSRTSPGRSVRTLSRTLLAQVLAPSLTNPQITRLPDAGITVRATAPAPQGPEMSQTRSHKAAQGQIRPCGVLSSPCGPIKYLVGYFQRYPTRPHKALK